MSEFEIAIIILTTILLIARFITYCLEIKEILKNENKRNKLSNEIKDNT